MTGPAPLTSTSWLTAWTPDLPILLGVVVLTAGYLALARRRPGWPAARTGSFLIAMAVVLVATCSFLGVYAHTLFWALAAQDVLLATLAPVPLVLARPGELLRRREPRPASSSGLLGSVVVAGLLTTIYTSGLDQARLQHGWLLLLLQVTLLVVGCGFAGALFAEHGAAHGIRVLAAFLDGLVDAVPGLAVLAGHGRIAAAYYAAHPRSWGPSPSWDQQIAGSVMLVLSEAVGVPTIVLLLVRWVRSDSREAVEADRLLDAEDSSASSRADDLQRPWWETDPGPLGDRLGGSSRPQQ
jgi:putative copper resistance protein D